MCFLAERKDTFERKPKPDVIKTQMLGTGAIQQPNMSRDPEDLTGPPLQWVRFVMSFH